MVFELSFTKVRENDFFSIAARLLLRKFVKLTLRIKFWNQGPPLM